MANYRYVKLAPVTVTVPLLPFFSITLGASILVWVIAPILSFALFYASGDVVSPLPDAGVTEVNAAESSVDFSRASNWFPKNPAKKTIAPVDAYTLTIPKLRIKNAVVKIGTDDLSKNLIHYGGTALPGKEGNAVVFGHSVLPTFYDPHNYLTIFSLLPTLVEGDEIFISFDGIDYRYEVIGKRVTKPADVSGLEQKYDDSYITLVTCVPPGTYWERLWLTARQKPFGVVKK
jgi:sortase A